MKKIKEETSRAETTAEKKISGRIKLLTSVCITPYPARAIIIEASMQFDPALAAQETFRRAEAELDSDWDTAVELEETFSSNAGATARAAYEQLLSLATRHPNAHSFQAFCIYITWQQATEETITRHFQTGVRLCEAYLVSREAKHLQDMGQITELYKSFRAGLGLEEEDEIQVEFSRDTPKGGD
jgi:hypothetical protein